MAGFSGKWQKKRSSDRLDVIAASEDTGVFHGLGYL